MCRLACIDIGTNSILLLVADVGEDGTLTPLADESEITRLGKGVDSSGRLSAQAIERSLKAVETFSRAAHEAGAREIRAIGTSALRDASNGQDFLQEAQRFTGSPVRVISGDEEALLSWLSIASDDALHARPPVVMADVGGGSTELAAGSGTAPDHVVSINMGAVRLTERFLITDPYTAGEIRAAREAAKAAFAQPLAGGPYGSLAGIGGTIVNLACIAGGGTHHEAVHTARLSRIRIRQIIDDLAGMPLEKRRETPGLEKARADVIVAGAIIFEALLDRLGLQEVITSIRGARFGALLQAQERSA